jgi:hypothetical protein
MEPGRNDLSQVTSANVFQLFLQELRHATRPGPRDSMWPPRARIKATAPRLSGAKRNSATSAPRLNAAATAASTRLRPSPRRRCPARTDTASSTLPVASPRRAGPRPRRADARSVHRPPRQHRPRRIDSARIDHDSDISHRQAGPADRLGQARAGGARYRAGRRRPVAVRARSAWRRCRDAARWQG